LTAAFLLALPALAQTAPGGLKIAETGFHQIEDGPKLPTGGYFVPGETVFFRAMLTGYATGKDKSVKLSYTIEPVDQEQVPLVAPISKSIEETLSEQDKNWRPVIRHSFLMPPFVFSGTYLVRMTVKDEISGAQASVEAPFNIRGHDPDKSQTVAIRNFHFFRAETDSAPLKIAASGPEMPCGHGSM
jgi:hypothetical protein